MTLAELRTYCGDAVNDATTAQIDMAIANKYRDASVRSRWLKKEIALATTVVDQSVYTFSTPNEAAIQRVEQIRIDTMRFMRVPIDTLRELQAGRATLTEGDGAFAPSFTSAGLPGIEVWRTPDTAGDTITAITVEEPAALTSGTSPIFPADLHEFIGQGAIGDLLARLDEQTGDANWWLSLYEAGVEKLIERQDGRIGDGPRQMGIAGYQFSL